MLCYYRVDTLTSLKWRHVHFRVAEASAHNTVTEWSEYFHPFHIDARRRYAAETSMIGIVDTYNLKQGDFAEFPLSGSTSSYCS